MTSKLITIKSKKFKLKDSYFDYDYQIELTNKLDKIKTNFNQNIINEIVLWKINRYANIDSKTLKLLNKIKSKDRLIDVDLTKKILSALLDIKGIQLPMASTILRFKNKYLYQIIDQRVYRIIYNKDLKLSTNKQKQIELYLEYLECIKGITILKFYQIDRVLYKADKDVNKTIPLNNYGSNQKNTKK